MSAVDMHPKLARLDARRAALREKTRLVTAEVQAACPHEIVLHAPYRRGIIFDQKPRRVCPRCGLCEQDWTFSSVTGKVLTDRPGRVFVPIEQDKVNGVSRGEPAR